MNGLPVPFAIQRRVLEQLLRAAYPDAVRDGAFAPLRGRWLRLDVLHGPGWNVTLGIDAPIVVAGPVQWDVRIAASLGDYIRLANQQADPDTLFFQRRLLIEGDTALGLELKNLVFGSELAGVPARLAQALGSLQAWAAGERALPWPPGLPLPPGLEGWGGLPPLPPLPLPALSRMATAGGRRLDATRRAQAGAMPAWPNQ